MSRREGRKIEGAKKTRGGSDGRRKQEAVVERGDIEEGKDERWDEYVTNKVITTRYFIFFF